MSEETKPESAAAIRAMAIQEAAKAAISLYRDKAQHLPSYDEGWNDACDAAEQSIRALSPAPQVTEEWVAKIAMEREGMDYATRRHAVRATLAALGIEVRK